MNTNVSPDRQVIVSDLKEVCSRVYEALLFGSGKAREYFDGLKHSIDLPLAANVARYHAKRFCNQTGPRAKPFHFEEVPNNGISIRQGVYSIKVLKGMDGQPPSHSKTNKARAFYNQIPPRQLPLFDIGRYQAWEAEDWPQFALSTSKLNLILCWHVDESYDIADVELVVPRHGWKYQQTVKLFWREYIPHPVTGIIGLPTINATPVVDLIFPEEENAATND